MTKIRDNYRSLLVGLVLTLSGAASGCMDGPEEETSEPSVASEQAEVQSCGVRNGKLWCKNKYKAPVYPWAQTRDDAWDALHTTYSWFACFAYGEYHAGKNYTWYYTQGDEEGLWGWVAAVNLSTSSAFDANPAAHGLPHCNNWSPPN